MIIYIDKNYPEEFIKQLIDYIKRRLLTISNLPHQKQDKFLYDYVFSNKRKYLSKDIILSMRDNMIYTKYKDRYMIEFNPEVYFPYYSIRVIDVFKLLYYGCSEIRPDQDLQNLYKYINRNIKDLYELYLRGSLKCL